MVFRDRMDCPECGSFNSMQALECAECGYAFPRAKNAKARRARTNEEAREQAERNRQWQADPGVAELISCWSETARSLSGARWAGLVQGPLLAAFLVAVEVWPTTHARPMLLMLFGAPAAAAGALLSFWLRWQKADLEGLAPAARRVAFVARLQFLLVGTELAAAWTGIGPVGLSVHEMAQVVLAVAAVLLTGRMLGSLAQEIEVELPGLRRLAWQAIGASVVLVACYVALRADVFYAERTYLLEAVLISGLVLVQAHMTSFRSMGELSKWFEEAASIASQAQIRPKKKKKKKKEKRKKKQRKHKRTDEQPQRTIEDEVAMLTRAAELPAVESDVADDAAEELVLAVAEHPAPEHIPVVRQLYPELGERARAAALALLAELAANRDDAAGRAALRTWLELLRTHGWPETSFAGRAAAPFGRTFTHGDVLFPALVDGSISGKGPGYALCLDYCRVERVAPEQLEPAASNILERYAALRDRIEPAQQSDGIAWRWADDYVDARIGAGLFLDLIGYLPVDRVEAELRAATDLDDPHLVCFAVGSLLRLGADVSDDLLERVAANDEMRVPLMQILLALECADRFPKAFFDATAIARAHMVEWLVHPAELGREPDELELMKVVEVEDEGDEPVRYYVFRFRTFEPHWAAHHGWMAGVAGPYGLEGGPDQLGGTFSMFTPWDECDAREHLARIRKLLGRMATRDGLRAPP